MLTLKLPASTRAADGRVRPYRFRGYAERQRVVLAADCAIPNTEAAYKQMNLHFGVKPEHAGRGWKEGGAVPLSTDYLLDGLEVNACRSGGEWPDCEAAPPPPPPDNSTQPCWGGDNCGGGGTYTPTGRGDDPDPQSEPCNTGLRVLDSPEVQEGFSDLWSRSGFGKPMAERREQGGWLMQRSDGSLYVQPFPSEWASQSCGIRVPAGTVPPNGTIAMVHTHPYTDGEPLTTCGKQPIQGLGSFYINYGNQPSGDDYLTMQNLRSIPGAGNLIGIVIDNEKITAYDGSSNARGQTQLNRCGY